MPLQFSLVFYVDKEARREYMGIIMHAMHIWKEGLCTNTKQAVSVEKAVGLFFLFEIYLDTYQES